MHEGQTASLRLHMMSRFNCWTLSLFVHYCEIFMFDIKRDIQTCHRWLCTPRLGISSSFLAANTPVVLNFNQTSPHSWADELVHPCADTTVHVPGLFI